VVVAVMVYIDITVHPNCKGVSASQRVTGRLCPTFNGVRANKRTKLFGAWCPVVSHCLGCLSHRVPLWRMVSRGVAICFSL
jgi:hypothetical protein